MFDFSPSPELLKQLMGGLPQQQMPNIPNMGMQMPMPGGLDVGAGMSRPMPMQDRQMMPPMNPMPTPTGGGIMHKFSEMKRSNPKRK